MPKYRKKRASPPVDHTEKLSGDVLSNIFIRLLAKQLAQMRCVCKFWNALLSESSFIKSHLHRSIHNNNNKPLLFFKNGYTIHSNPGPSTARPSRSPNLEDTSFSKLKLPVDPRHKKALGYVVGSVNGLICFTSELNNDDCVIRIWNPSLSATLTLPRYPVFFHGDHLMFGFDPRTDDYKVVRCTMQPKGVVYSMRNGSWEFLPQSVPPHIKLILHQSEVCVDGHMHRLCHTFLKQKPSTILTFDLSAMTFGEIPLPDSLMGCDNLLGVLGGKLCVMSRVINRECEVWVMGDDKLWVKQHLFSQFSYYIKPYGFTSQNEFLFQVNRHDFRFGLCDPVAAKTKIFKIKSRILCERYKIIEYVDSLVWLSPKQLKLDA